MSAEGQGGLVTIGAPPSAPEGLLTASYLNVLVAASTYPDPLDWTPWAERPGWFQAPVGSSVYEIGQCITLLSRGALKYLVHERRGKPCVTFTLRVGPADQGQP